MGHNELDHYDETDGNASLATMSIRAYMATEMMKVVVPYFVAREFSPREPRDANQMVEEAVALAERLINELNGE